MIPDVLAPSALALDYPKNGGEDLVELYPEDGMFTIPELSMVAEGPDQIRRFAEGIHETVPGLHHVTTNIAVDVLGDIAYGRAELSEFMLRKRLSITIFTHGTKTIAYAMVTDGYLR